jgi:hypothetical protein
MPQKLPPGEAERRKKMRDKERVSKWRKDNPEKYKQQWQRRRDKQAEYYQENKEDWHSRLLKKEYGISLLDYNNMLIEQQNVCDICKNKCVSGKNLAVDHDHDTGKVRGLLCCKCNRGLGNFNDNLDLLEYAVLYLKKHK